MGQIWSEIWSLVPPRGGNRYLKSFQNGGIAYDATMDFWNPYVNRLSRRHDQMMQAARSGKQNIRESSVISGISKKIEMKLVGIARASLDEFLGDYECFLRQREMQQ